MRTDTQDFSIQGGPKKVRRSYKIVFNYCTNRFLSLHLYAKQRLIIRHHVQCVSPGFWQLFPNVGAIRLCFCKKNAAKNVSIPRLLPTSADQRWSSFAKVNFFLQSSPHGIIDWFKSGLFACHISGSMKVIFFWCKKLIVFLAVWDGAPSCCHVQIWYGDHISLEYHERTMSENMSQ